MTIEQWHQKCSGWEITIPKGTVLIKYVGHPPTLLAHETKVLIEINEREISALVKKAIRNKSRRSRDGALTVKVTSKRPAPPSPKAPRCPSTLIPGDPEIQCVLHEGHEGSHQDHLLPKRRWTGD